jgi:aldehyde dehydrogenase (NAD+)
MDDARRFYIDGGWVEPLGGTTADVVDPSTEEVFATVALGTPVDVDRAVSAARRAFDGFSGTSREERLALLERIMTLYAARKSEMGALISREMGAPLTLALDAQAQAGYDHFEAARDTLRDFAFEEQMGTTRVLHEPVGACGLITPWNWPMFLIAAKVAPALATGCTMVLKPSEMAPLNAILFAEILDEAGVPPGVFNLVNGDGPTVGAAIAAHPDLDMVSFTGLIRAGIDVAAKAAPTVKRVTQELGGKSADIILDDADLDEVIPRDVEHLCVNTGQTCTAPTRMLVPRAQMDRAARIAAAAADRIVVGDPRDDATDIGPVASRQQLDRVQHLIGVAIGEGARLVTGGLGRLDQLPRGYYVRPTVFSHVTNEMSIAREEVFGPVLAIIGYDSDDDAIRIANDSTYGLYGYVSSPDLDRARAVARRIRAGMIEVNLAGIDIRAPFGGYRRSGNGREYGRRGFEEYLEAKSITGYLGAPA